MSVMPAQVFDETLEQHAVVSVDPSMIGCQPLVWHLHTLHDEMKGATSAVITNSMP